MTDTLDSVELLNLLNGSKSGNQKDFAKLYNLTSPYLYALVKRIVGQAAMAEDVLQESYIQIWQQISRFNPTKGTPLAWMTTIVRSRALDRIRHEKSQHTRVEKITAEPMMGLVEDASQHQRFSKEFEKLAHCLQPISAEQRRAIILAFCYGLTHSELSAAIKAPIGTVKSWVRRGLTSVRRCMKS